MLLQPDTIWSGHGRVEPDTCRVQITTEHPPYEIMSILSSPGFFAISGKGRYVPGSPPKKNVREGVCFGLKVIKSGASLRFRSENWFEFWRFLLYWYEILQSSWNHNENFILSNWFKFWILLSLVWASSIKLKIQFQSSNFLMNDHFRRSRFYKW